MTRAGRALAVLLVLLTGLAATVWWLGVRDAPPGPTDAVEIGRASCRERVSVVV